MGDKFVAFADKKTAAEYINGYQKENYERITILMPKEKGKALKEYCKSKNIKASAFINQCIDEKLKRMKIEL